MPSPHNNPLVAVTAADREAAAELAAQFQRYSYMQIEAPAIKGGGHDEWEFVQAFARHRIAHSSPLVAGLVEALEAFADWLDRADDPADDCDYLNEDGWDDVRLIRDRARKALASARLQAGGEELVLVPRVPTEAMLEAGADYLAQLNCTDWHDDAAKIYTAMIAAYRLSQPLTEKGEG